VGCLNGGGRIDFDAGKSILRAIKFKKTINFFTNTALDKIQDFFFSRPAC
jgi:hypothetical protein